MKQSFKALVVRQDGRNFSREIERRYISDLPDGEVLIRVHYSSINYKDILSCFGDKTVTRHYPHTPGIDAAGIVESSMVSDFRVGQSVVVISFDLGANTSGGFGQYIRVPASWVMLLPKGLSLRESMIYGTAGFTAGLSVNLLQKQGVLPDDGPILVTGATGGVGSISLALLSSLGYSVSASSGNKNANPFLIKLGALEVVSREKVIDILGRTLLKELWSGAIDTVGGPTLETILKSCKKKGVVVSTGLVSSSNISTSVFPFILRGISLIGSGASETSMKKRNEIWGKLAQEWKLKELDFIATDCCLDDLEENIVNIANGNQLGRVVINMSF